MKRSIMARRKKPLTVKEMGARGGKARAKALTKEERSDAARKAVQARWAQKRGRDDGGIHP